MHAPIDPLLDETEAATVTGVSTKTLRTWRSRGRLSTDGVPAPCFLKIGRSVRYRLSDLQVFVEAFPKVPFTAAVRNGTDAINCSDCSDGAEDLAER